MNRLTVQNDQLRDIYLRQQGIKVMRFNNLEILKELDAVVDKVHQTAVSRI
jgi:very-short-patch-repair endonuclease